MKRVDLDKLETELEKWHGEVPLPCDIVVSMIAELRSHRAQAKPRTPTKDPYTLSGRNRSIR